MTDYHWFTEDGCKNVVIQFRCLGEIYSGRSQYARIDIVDTVEYGRMLFLDGIAQSAELDEFIYHENLVHPAMLCHPSPEKVCVIGGAEGATIREVCKYPQVAKIVMVDIDEKLVRICQEKLGQWSAGAFDDHRLQLLFDDGRRYLEQTDEVFDVILVDLDDPTEGSPAVYLFTREFYQLVFNRLTPQGVACFQGECLQPNRLKLHARMYNTLAAVFPWVVAYPYAMPSFHEVNAHILVSKDSDPRQIDLAARLQEQPFTLRHLSGPVLKGLFAVPAYVEQAYKEIRELITDSDPHLYQA
ncbi:MAG: fused MFS/spermidine synthase [Deltaproteobacteria bacterium]|nr:fused MFS/spermidine synthase [Deltaproteobacteria bacterium]MBW2072173.1 fused MFS/spermidine synthase [Deltaproteobacteria bacterium]